MPVIAITALPFAPSIDRPAVLTGLCEGLAETCGLPLAHISATWRTLDAGCYCDAGVPAATQPQRGHPVLVDVTCFDLTDDVRIQAVLEFCGRYLETTLSLPGNVFVQYHCARPGQVYAQGGIVD